MYAWPVEGSTVGLNVAGPKPFHTGMFGVIVWVRSMYLAFLNVCSYVCHRSIVVFAFAVAAGVP